MNCANCGHDRIHHIKVYSSERCWFSREDDKACDCEKFEEKENEMS
jgi:hypothetical protein